MEITGYQTKGYKSTTEALVWIFKGDVGHKVTCLTHHLKKVEINSFVWKKIASKLVKYFLKNGKVLEKITISCRDYVLGNKRFARKLEAPPNVSISFPTFMGRKPLWFKVEDDGSNDDFDDSMDEA